MMANLTDINAGRFCWVDLAATDAERAKAFYGQLFGWAFREQPANGGRFTYVQLSGQNVGSLYQLRRNQLNLGVASHWTPYIHVDDVADAAGRAACFDGKVIVRPFEVSGVARIALIQDSVGAHFGLWEPIEANAQEVVRG
ncbi:MAG: VOC family protein [Hyphomicrobiales bacterium]